MSNYENNKNIQYIDFLKLVEIEVLTITSIIAVYSDIYNKNDQGHEILLIMKWDS